MDYIASKIKNKECYTFMLAIMFTSTFIIFMISVAFEIFYEVLLKPLFNIYLKPNNKHKIMVDKSTN